MGQQHYRWRIAAFVLIGCSSSGDAQPADAGPAITQCYDAPHEGMGTVSFELGSRTVQLAATVRWIIGTDLGVTASSGDSGVHESWGMELLDPALGTHTCDPSSGIVGIGYVDPDSAQFGTMFPPAGTCTVAVVEDFPRWKAHFDAKVVAFNGDAGKTVLHLANGEIDLEVPGWCPLTSTTR